MKAKFGDTVIWKSAAGYMSGVVVCECEILAANKKMVNAIIVKLNKTKKDVRVTLMETAFASLSLSVV